VLFEHVLINLIENALKHAAPPFSIAVHRRGDHVVIEIADRGPGLPAQVSDLFEKFVRASSAPGVGLGLAVVRAIVVAHGGMVTAHPRPGGGAVFEVQIPAGTPPVTLLDEAVPAGHSVPGQAAPAASYSSRSR
jgi:two-component system sensor histidine kinase KdpD